LGAVIDRVPGARDAVEEVAFGDTNQAGEDNRDVARMAALLAQLPYEVTGVTLNRLCGSGLEALVYCARAIRLGDHEVTVAGGVESMTRAPYALEKPAEPFPRQAPRMFDTSLGWRFTNPKMAERFSLDSLGQTAENVAERYGISREEQDAFALESHRKAAAAWEAGAFADEVVPVMVPPASKREAPTTFEKDECIRPDSSLEKLAKLPAVFKKDGTVTAGNASPLNDGASAMLVTSGSWAEKNGFEPLARFKGSAVVGVEPNYMGIGPIPAVKKLVEKTGISLDDVDLFELNEAFAAQSVPCVRELGLDPAKVNVHGGAIAIGHPVGCSGARITTTLAHAMKRRGARYGIATLCIGVGQGLAVLLERP
jgi:acetyl-CoA acetyltransferase family protein